MIENRIAFRYKGKELIEKLIIRPPFSYSAIFHNEGCFIYVKGAKTKLLSSEVNLDLKDKEAVLLKCGSYFADWMKKATQPVTVIVVHLYPDLLKHLYKNELPKSLKRREVMDQTKIILHNDFITKFIESLEFYFDNPSLINDDLLELKIRELILLLIQTQNASSILELIEELYSPRVANLKQVINLHQYENLSIEELATLCGLSVSSFKRDFKEIYDDSPGSYLTIKKIEKAKELLQVGDLSISEISYHVGFNDPYYFTRTFKKKEGVPPSIYREQFQS
ncbi:helix-turn-helix domain-containing protein [Reichenbachiella versicolor]|uniref:helix-turn-helix domain-containing protein n=1 Tax=Reichenbachiella versicolor TaxID=1821036 RepID=UPI000D6E94D1|nr:AraC family transcriptional regulator [Reichenbachiella versicolor]